MEAHHPTCLTVPPPPPVLIHLICLSFPFLFIFQKLLTFHFLFFSFFFPIGKFHSRSYKIAYALLNKLSKHGGGGAGGSGTAELLGSSSVKPGDRVALVYPNSDAIGFICAFYGCLHAGVVPVPIEVPLTRRDAGSQQIGFLLGSCGVQVALTSDICLKGLPKTASSGEVIAFKGWPKLHWCVTDNLIKPPKDWQPPPKLQDDTPAYIEVHDSSPGSY